MVLLPLLLLLAPPDAMAWERYGRQHAERGEHAAAIRALTEALAQTAEPNAAARLHRRLSDAHAAARQWDAAVGEFEKYLSIQPVGPEPYRCYADLLHRAGRQGEIETKLSDQAGVQPRNPAIAWVQAAELARRDFPNGRLRFALLMPTATDPAFFELLVDTYVDLNQPRALLGLLDEFFPVPPDGRPAPEASPEAAQRRVNFVKALDQHSAFAPDLLRAARGPYSPPFWDALAGLAERADKPEDYETSLRQTLNPRNQRNVLDVSTAAFEQLARHLMHHRQWQKLLFLAGDVSPRSAQIAPSYLAVLRAEALTGLGQGDEALTLLREQPGGANFAIRRRMANILFHLGRHEEMLQTLDAMLAEYKSPADVRDIHTLRAESLLGLGRFDDMEALFRRLLDDEPDDALVLNNLGYNLADKNRKLVEAEKLIRRAIELDRRERAKTEPRIDNGIYLDSLGWVLFRRGRLAEARQCLEQAVALPEGRTDAIVWDHLGDVCFRLGDKPAAKKAWQNAEARYVGDQRGKEGGRAAAAKQKLKLAE